MKIFFRIYGDKETAVSSDDKINSSHMQLVKNNGYKFYRIL